MYYEGSHFTLCKEFLAGKIRLIFSNTLVFIQRKIAKENCKMVKNLIINLKKRKMFDLFESKQTTHTFY